MSFVSSQSIAVGDSFDHQLLEPLLTNTLIDADRINGDDAEGTGETGHDHTGSGEGVVLPLGAFDTPLDFSRSVHEIEEDSISAAFRTILTHNFTPVSRSSIYVIDYCWEMTCSLAGSATSAKVIFTVGSVELAFSRMKPVDGGDYKLYSGFSVGLLTFQPHEVTMQFNNPAPTTGTSRIRRARISTWRVS